jgi:UDP-N-acetylglucosamine 4,6-dehydratase
MIKGHKIFITGGSGSLGHELAHQLSEHNQIVIYSRNEESQYNMQQTFHGKAVEFFIGDVRDRYSLELALGGCDLAIHAAAMKDLIMCERQPTQTFLNNIEGSKSFIEAIKRSDVKKAIAVSTDKAASPSNVYGASKYIMEKMFEEANRTSDKIFASVRFGNMIDSKGSLVFIWKNNPDKEYKLTHPEVSRFFFTLREGAETVVEALSKAEGGEIFIRKMKKAKIVNILKMITGRENFEIMGLYPGEKIHEDLLSKNEVNYCHEQSRYYVIRPDELNENPPEMFSTENAVEFTTEELGELIYSGGAV